MPSLVSSLIVHSVVLSSLLALLSVGLTLTYLTTKVPNFAHGGVATLGLYVGLTSVKVWNSNPYLFAPLAFLVGAGAGLLLYFGVIRPLMRRGTSLVGLMISTIGFDLFLFSVINIYADYLRQSFRVVSRGFIIQDADFILDPSVFGPSTPGIFLIGPIIVAMLSFSLYTVLTRIRFGVAMRAVVENPSLAQVVGINVDLVYAVSWLVSGGLAGLAGLLAGLLFTGRPDLGAILLPSIFAASVVGGLGSIYGAIAGSVIVASSQELLTSYIAFANPGLVGILAYKLLLPLVLMVLTLLFAPRGLGGIDWAFLTKRLRGVITPGSR